MDQIVEVQDKPARADFIRARGVRLPMDPAILTPRLRNSLRNGTYERAAADVLPRMLISDDVLIELGGGIGFLSTLAAKKVKSVHAFEANADLTPYAERVFEANGIENAQMRNVVLGAKKTKVPFYLRRNMLTSSLRPLEGETDVTEQSVPMVNARTVMKEIKPTVMLCNIEGAEDETIAGIDLSGLRAALVMLHPRSIGSKGVAAIFAAMAEAGLTYFPRRSAGKLVCFRRDW